MGGCVLAGLTLGEARRVVVDVGQGDADRGGPREPAHLARHVLGLDHHLVILLDLPVHAGEGRLDQAWKDRKQSGIKVCPPPTRFQERRCVPGASGASLIVLIKAL